MEKKQILYRIGIHWEREQRQKAQEALEDRAIALFEEGEGTYGVERICDILRRDGESASYKVIQRIMHQKDLKSCHRIRRQRSLTDSQKARGDEYKNLTKNLVINNLFQVISTVDFSCPECIKYNKGEKTHCFHSGAVMSTVGADPKLVIDFEMYKPGKDSFPMNQG